MICSKCVLGSGSFSRFHVLELQIPHLIKTRRFPYEGTLSAALVLVSTCGLPPRPAPLDTVGERLWGCQPAVLRSLRFYMLPGTDLSQLIRAEKKVVLGAPLVVQWLRSTLPRQGAWGQSPVRELRFHVLHDAAPKIVF